MKKTLLLAAMATVTFLVQYAMADELIIYAVPPRSEIRWDQGPATMATDGLLAAGIGKLKGSAHNVGHASIELKCEGLDGKEPRHFNAGMTSQSDDGAERQLLFVKKVGLGVLLEGSPGRVENTEELHKDLDPRLQSNDRVHFLRFVISSETCRRLEKYYDEFMQRGYGKMYGFPSKPREGRGAACTSFAYSFLEVAGLWAPEFKENWVRKYRIPLRLVGRETAQKYVTDPRDIEETSFQVFPTKVLDQSYIGKRWACDDEPGINYTARDVQFMTDWLNGVIKGETKSTTFDFREDRIGKAVGLVADVRNVPTPRDPMFLEPKIEDLSAKKPATQSCIDLRVKLDNDHTK